MHGSRQTVRALTRRSSSYAPPEPGRFSGRRPAARRQTGAITGEEEKKFRAFWPESCAAPDNRALERRGTAGQHKRRRLFPARRQELEAPGPAFGCFEPAHAACAMTAGNRACGPLPAEWASAGQHSAPRYAAILRHCIFVRARGADFAAIPRLLARRDFARARGADSEDFQGDREILVVSPAPFFMLCERLLAPSARVHVQLKNPWGAKIVLVRL
jgi:hypothetical protein